MRAHSLDIPVYARHEDGVWWYGFLEEWRRRDGRWWGLVWYSAGNGVSRRDWRVWPDELRRVVVEADGPGVTPPCPLK